MPQPVKSGVSTSEYGQAKAGSLWGIIATILGILISVGGTVGEVVGANTKLAIIAGVVVSVAGAVQTTLVQLGYINSRTEVKKAASGEPKQ